MIAALQKYDNAWFQRGRTRWVEAAWIVLQAAFVASWIPGSAHRRFLLRLFGAKIGKSVDLKPGMRVKFPWRLSVGDHSWIGEDAWIDNLAQVEIGSNCCISQGAYLCTGSHNWSSDSFDLIVRPITIRDSAWIAAFGRVGPGVTVGEGAVLAFASVATHDIAPFAIAQGNPARTIGRRNMSAAPGDMPQDGIKRLI